MESGRTPTAATLHCANCRQSWLVPGLRRGETHVCKGCGHRVLFEGRNERPPGETTRPGGKARLDTAGGKV